MSVMGCPACGAPLYGDATDLTNGVIDCPSCAAVFEQRDAVPLEEPWSPRVLVPPSGIVVVEEGAAAEVVTYRDRPRAGGPVRIVRGWSSQWTIALAISAVLLGIVVFALQDGSLGLVSTFLMLGLAATALSLGCTGLVELAGGTMVHIGREEVRVSRGPLPWRAGARIPVASIERLSLGYRRVELGFAYSVVAETQRGASCVLVRDLPTEAEARFIADFVAARLGLPVPL
jgi:hypothetical protein